jgi:cell division protein FtsQ
MVMAVLIAIAAFPQSALFTVERIEVTGASTVTPQTIIAVAGLREGQRLFAVDAEEVLRRLRADPRIKAARVRVRPPHAVRLDVVERRPLLALALDEGGFVLVGDDLVAIALVPTAAGVPEVVDRIRTVPWARPGAPVASEAARIALAVLPLLGERFAGDLQRLVVSPGPDLTLGLRSGLQIRAGGLVGLSERLAQVPRILEALRARGLQAAALDLRYAGSVAVTLLTGGEAR